MVCETRLSSDCNYYAIVTIVLQVFQSVRRSDRKVHYTMQLQCMSDLRTGYFHGCVIHSVATAVFFHQIWGFSVLSVVLGFLSKI